MATYFYKCRDCEIDLEVDKPMALASEPVYCPECDGDCKRVYTVPQISVPVYKAADVMNEYASGERVLQGYNREQTIRLANGLHKAQKKNKGMKAASHPTISTGTNPVPVQYVPASSE